MTCSKMCLNRGNIYCFRWSSTWDFPRPDRDTPVSSIALFVPKILILIHSYVIGLILSYKKVPFYLT
jgi:hypothetical protein